MTKVEGRKVSQKDFAEMLGVSRSKIDLVERRDGGPERSAVTTEMAELLFEKTGALVHPFEFSFPLHGGEEGQISPGPDEVLNLDGSPFTADNYRKQLDAQQPVHITPDPADSPEQSENKARAAKERARQEWLLLRRIEVALAAGGHAGRWGEVFNRIVEAVGSSTSEYIDRDALDRALQEWNDTQDETTIDEIPAHPILQPFCSSEEGRAAVRKLQERLRREFGEDAEVRVPLQFASQLTVGYPEEFGTLEAIEFEIRSRNDRGEVVEKWQRLPLKS